MHLQSHRRTPRQYVRWLVTWMGFAGFALLLLLPWPGQPKIQGKAPQQWARLLTAHPTESKSVPPSLVQVLVPYLIEEIQRNPDSFHSELSVRLSSLLYDLLPETFLFWVPEPVLERERQLNAIILLGEFGPLARDAVPALIPLLDDEALQCSVIFALQAIGPAARPAVPRLLQLLTEDPDFRIATALANLAPDEPEVIRVLGEVSRAGLGDISREATAALDLCADKLSASLALVQRETATLLEGAFKAESPEIHCRSARGVGGIEK